MAVTVRFKAKNHSKIFANPKPSLRICLCKPCAKLKNSIVNKTDYHKKDNIEPCKYK